MDSNDKQTKETELREFDLMATEKYAHLTVREVWEKLESGQIESHPIQ